jgi:anti-sigma factor RsiW
MSEREASTDAAHKVVDALLPWFVNGTLDREENLAVERHLHECASCRAEVEWLRGPHAACVAASDVSPAAARLRAGLEARPRRRPARLGWGLALAGSLVALGVAGTAAWIGGNEPAYRTLGASDAAAARGALVVVFDPATPESELRRILRAAGAQIVDGPTRTNAYVLDVPPAQRTQALAALRGERRVVLAERLDGGAAR